MQWDQQVWWWGKNSKFLRDFVENNNEDDRDKDGVGVVKASRWDKISVVKVANKLVGDDEQNEGFVDEQLEMDDSLDNDVAGFLCNSLQK